MTLSTFGLNGGAINKDTEIFGVFSGAIISFTQTVQAQFSGSVISFEQDVEKFATYTGGTVISFAQKVQKQYAGGTCIKFEQNVKTALHNTYYTRNGYDVDLYINNKLIAKNQITDTLTISRSEGSASQLTFTLLPASGVQTPETYLGQSCFVTGQDSTGTFRMFTGWVDNPELDIIAGKIKFSCSDRRTTQINNLSNSIIADTGTYSVYVSGQPTDQADELEKRLQTVPSAFDFNAYGLPTLTPWAPKATADFTLGNSGVYYEDPKIMYSKRDKSVNSVTITFTYKHVRLHNQAINVVWQGYDRFNQDWYDVGSPSFPQRSTIASAASSSSWYPITPIKFNPLWPAGAYGGVLWQPNQVTYTYAPETIEQPILYQPPFDAGIGGIPPPTLIWPDGKEHFNQVAALDTNGNPIMTVSSTTVTDTSSDLCRGATWASGKKFSQHVNEVYAINITSPSAISKYGIISQDYVINMSDPYDTSGWEKNRVSFTTSYTAGTATGAFINLTTNSSLGTVSANIVAAGSGSINIGDLYQIIGDSSGQLYESTVHVSSVASGYSNFPLSGQAGLISVSALAALNSGQYPIQLIPNPGSGANYFIDEKPLYPAMKNAMQVALNRADTLLRKSFRDVHVDFKRSLWPAIDLAHTVALTATKIACKAKVQKIDHYINCTTGEGYTKISLVLSRPPGTDSQSTYNVTMPPYENTSYIGSPILVGLQTHYGINPDPAKTPGVVLWNGYIGNAAVKGQSTDTNHVTAVRTTYPTSFTVTYPPLSAALTNERTLISNPPAVHSGATTDSAGYLSGATSVTLAAAGTGAIYQGDSISIAGDSSAGTYIVQNDVLNVGVGGVLSISPGLGASLSGATHAITSSPAANNFTIQIPQDSLTVTF